MMIGLSGNAKSGKDTMYRLLRQIDKKFERFSLADYLKEELNDFTIENLGISAFTTVPKQKELLRKLMVEYGRIKRIQTEGKYFTNKVDIDLRCHKYWGNYKEMVPVITDIRYCHFKEDELWWLKEKHKGCLVYIETWDQNSLSYLPPANQDEMDNNYKLKNAADYVLHWHKSDNEEYLMNKAKEFYKWYDDRRCGCI